MVKYLITLIFEITFTVLATWFGMTLEEFKKKQTNKCRLIGLDLGSKRIGVSISDEKQLIATPFKTILKTNTNELIDKLKEIINEYDIKGIIIGNPINMDGSLGRSAQSVNDSLITYES